MDSLVLNIRYQFNDRDSNQRVNLTQSFGNKNLSMVQYSTDTLWIKRGGKDKAFLEYQKILEIALKAPGPIKSPTKPLPSSRTISVLRVNFLATLARIQTKVKLFFGWCPANINQEALFIVLMVANAKSLWTLGAHLPPIKVARVHMNVKTIKWHGFSFISIYRSRLHSDRKSSCNSASTCIGKWSHCV